MMAMYSIGPQTPVRSTVLDRRFGVKNSSEFGCNITSAPAKITARTNSASLSQFKRLVSEIALDLLGSEHETVDLVEGDERPINSTSNNCTVELLFENDTHDLWAVEF